MIRKATMKDLESLLSILQSVGNRYKDPSQGFLMDDYSQNKQYYRKKYANDLKSLTYAYVHEGHDRVNAFLIAYTHKEWLNMVPDWTNQIHWHPDFDHSRLDMFVLINQTAMYPKLTGKGFGSLLYDALIKDMKKDDIKHIFAETVIAPVPNLASLNFRLKQKYEVAGMRYEEVAGKTITTLVYYKPVYADEKILPFSPLYSNPADSREHAG